MKLKQSLHIRLVWSVAAQVYAGTWHACTYNDTTIIIPVMTRTTRSYNFSCTGTSCLGHSVVVALLLTTAATVPLCQHASSK